MKILIEIIHPGSVHMFKYLITELKEKGHDIKVLAVKKDINLTLLDYYGIDYTLILKSTGKSLISKMYLLILGTIKSFFHFLEFKPDITVGRESPIIALNSMVFFKKHFAFSDTEHTKYSHIVSEFTSYRTFTPSCFFLSLGKKHVRYKGYHELTYLHPNRFKPDKKVLDEIDLSANDTFFVVRFVSWSASHDFGEYGFSLKGKRELIKLLEKHGRVIITSEAPLPEEFEKYRMSICPTKIHDLLYYATMYIGEGGTMASEAAVLGTPSIFVNTLTLGYLEELENKYDLMYSFKKEKEAINKTKELLEIPDLKTKWQNKRQKMLEDKIDVTAWMVDLIENAVK